MRIKTLLTSLVIVFYIGTSMAQEKIPIWNDVRVKGAESRREGHHRLSRR